jgi:hypothetical protein
MDITFYIWKLRFELLLLDINPPENLFVIMGWSKQKIHKRRIRHCKWGTGVLKESLLRMDIKSSIGEFRRGKFHSFHLMLLLDSLFARKITLAFPSRKMWQSSIFQSYLNNPRISTIKMYNNDTCLRIW